MSLVELTLTMEATVLTQTELDSLQQKLVLLIGDNTRVHIRDLKIEHKTGQVVIVFYVDKVSLYLFKLKKKSSLKLRNFRTKKSRTLSQPWRWKKS